MWRRRDGRRDETLAVVEAVETREQSWASCFLLQRMQEVGQLSEAADEKVLLALAPVGLPLALKALLA